MVLKTAELAPLTGQLFAEAWVEAGGPPGIFALLHGHGEDIGAAMSAHPGIDKIAFTGSTEVGRKIVIAATANLKKVSLELGGKSPVVIFPDADLRAAIPAASMACYLSTGQQCMAGSRLFVHEAVHDRVVEGIAAYAASLKVGDGMAPGTMLGPMISARQKARVESYIAIAKAEGAEVAYEAPAIEGSSRATVKKSAAFPGSRAPPGAPMLRAPFRVAQSNKRAARGDDSWLDSMACDAPSLTVGLLPRSSTTRLSFCKRK